MVRKALDRLLHEPELPLDEMTIADYMKARDCQERVNRQPELVEIGTSYEDFRALIEEK